jgi:hypothetical protein
MLTSPLLLLLLLFIRSPVSRRRLAPSASEAASFCTERQRGCFLHGLQDDICPIWQNPSRMT